MVINMYELYNKNKVVSQLVSTETDFLKCGVTGWCLEVVWTGFYNFIHLDKKMTSNTSIIMFPIYGMAAFIKPISRFLSQKNVMLRGSIYTVLIFAIEFLTGHALKKKEMCPWDYSKSRYNVKGLIRLDYAPAWFAVGLLYEKMLNR